MVMVLALSLAFQVFNKSGLRYGDVGLVPTLIPALVATQKNDGLSTGVECKQDSPRISSELHTKFLYLFDFGTLQRINVRPAQVGTKTGEHSQVSQDRILQVAFLRLEPLIEG
jgi:hypothetical protein